ncbi:hypothetical protein THAOC_01818, partial [Thalassiosira oceanica]
RFGRPSLGFVQGPWRGPNPPAGEGPQGPEKGGDCGFRLSKPQSFRLSGPREPPGTDKTPGDAIPLAPSGLVPDRRTPSRLSPSDENCTMSVLMDQLDDGMLKRCASYLRPEEMVSLGRVARRFGLPGGGETGSSLPDSSLVEAVARDVFAQVATEEDRLALPRYNDESSISLYNQLVKMRTSLEFSQLIGNDVFHPSVSSKSRVCGDFGAYWNSAISPCVMRGGRHFAKFSIGAWSWDVFVTVGVIRPITGWDERGIENFLPSIIDSNDSVSHDLLAERTEKWHGDIHCCSYCCWDGSCCRTDWYTKSTNDWVGQENYRRSSTTGLLLDLAEGSLSVFKDGRRLGTMASGLMGEYCWFAAMSLGNSCVSIERAALSEIV